MTGAILAALSAAVWGVGDFCGGKATQRAPALLVTVLSQAAVLPLLVVAVLVLPSEGPRAADLAWAAVAGVAGFVGILLLYRGLSGGTMAVFAPTSAVTAALIPLVVGLVTDHPPGGLALSGALVAVVAIALVSLGPAEGRGAVSSTVVILALASGTAFGVFFTLLGQTDPGSGMWPLLAVRVGSLAVGVPFLARVGVASRPAGGTAGLAVIAGVLDITANGLYLVAAQHGSLSVIAPIASLYPASTVLLALAVDGERVRPVQLAGLGLAATALVLVAT